MPPSNHPLRDKICVVVASLKEEDDVETTLKPLLDEAIVQPQSSIVGISPLLVAADRGNVKALHFLANYDTSIVGSPLDHSPQQDGGNTAVHHAAMSGCNEAWAVFGEMLKEKKSVYSLLGSVANAHGDTPLQIAVPAGHLYFIQQWNSRMKDEEDAKRILRHANHAGDTCASLACCHGQVVILEFLLDNCHVLITPEEIKTCQASVDRMDQALATVTDPKAMESFKGRQGRVHDCFNRLKTVVHQQAEDAAKELLLEDSVEATNYTTPANNNKPKKNKRKKKGKGKAPTNNNTSNITDDAATANGSTETSSAEELLHIRRLEDGRVAVSVQGQRMQDPAELLQPVPTAATPSADTMFRQRFHPPNDAVSDIDAVMDALCLDVSMLLYTPHGMALNLSPSQLDAVQQILQKQIGAVQEARNLQLQRTNNASGSAGSGVNER